jgi:hypothetical protein
VTRLDGPATAAIGHRLVDVYRAAMGAAPFHETEVETGFFAEELAREEGGRVVGFAHGDETPEVPSEGWYGLLRDAVGQGPDGAGRWLEGASTERAWLITHDLDTPARALYRSLGFRELGRGPLGWYDAERVLGAKLPPGPSSGR